MILEETKNEKGFKVGILQCDQCRKVYEVTSSKLTSIYRTKPEYHFCSRKCADAARKKGGLMDRKFRQSCLEKYGVENPSQVDEFQAKKIETCMENHGVRHQMHSEVVKEKIRQTNQDRRGVDFPMQSSDVKEKSKEKCLENWGVDNVFKSEEIKEKIKETNLETYGVEYSSQAEEVKEKKRQTNLQRRGVDYPLQSKKVREKMTDTCQSRYGVDNPSQVNEVKKKKHQTMKENGSYYKSNPEDRAYEILCEQFGKNDIERQRYIYGRPVDIYIFSLHLYVQFDGKYWHGLDRPLEEIMKCKTPRDKNIYEHVLRDRKENENFIKSNQNLIRVIYNNKHVVLEVVVISGSVTGDNINISVGQKLI